LATLSNFEEEVGKIIMKAALNNIQAKASEVDPGLGNVFTRVFDWLPELFDRAALEVALEELDPNYEAWSNVIEAGAEDIVKRVLERREKLYNEAKNVFTVIASNVSTMTAKELGGRDA
jgi:hypothetical protein